MLRVDSYEGPRGPATPTPPVTSPQHHSGKRKPLEPPERVCFLRRPPLPFVACRLRPPPPGEASWSGDTFGQGREGGADHPSARERDAASSGRQPGWPQRPCSQPQPGSSAPTPHSRLGLPLLPRLRTARRPPFTPAGPHSVARKRHLVSGKAKQGWPGLEKVVSHPTIPRPGSRIPVLPSHGCPAASLAVSLRHGPVRLARPLVLSPAPSTVPPLLPGGHGLNATSSGKPSQTTPSPRGPSHSGYIAPGEGHRWLSQ